MPRSARVARRASCSAALSHPPSAARSLMTKRTSDRGRHAWIASRSLPAVLVSVAMVAISTVVVGASPGWATSPLDDSETISHFPAKLKVLRATVRDGTLDVVLSITGRALGAITIDYQAAGRFRRAFVAVGSAQDGEKRLGISQALEGRQRAVKTGIINAAFAGDDSTLADSTRLRAANVHSGLTLERLTFTDGRLSVAGSIDRRVSGIVRLRASYLDVDGSIGLWSGRAAVAMGTWKLDEKLPAAATFDPNAYLTVQFTGQKDAPGGPFRGEQIGKSLGNLNGVSFTPPVDTVDQAPPDPGDSCGGDNEDDCG